MSNLRGRTTSRAGSGWPGRLIATATRWATASWTALNLLLVACLIDITGPGPALVGIGRFWLIGMGAIGLAATVARLTVWVGLDICDGLRAEVESMVRSLDPARWAKGLCRGSGVWDEWLDSGLPEWHRAGACRKEGETPGRSLAPAGGRGTMTGNGTGGLASA